jgi:hypothetical protein
MKKILRQSVMFAILSHLVYFAGMIGVGYYKTLTYQPEMPNGAEPVSNQVSFGFSHHPLYVVCTLLAAFMLYALLLLAGKRIFNKEL